MQQRKSTCALIRIYQGVAMHKSQRNRFVIASSMTALLLIVTSVAMIWAAYEQFSVVHGIRLHVGLIGLVYVLCGGMMAGYALIKISRASKRS